MKQAKTAGDSPTAEEDISGIWVWLSLGLTPRLCTSFRGMLVFHFSPTIIWKNNILAMQASKEALI
jgi:hypothetical protein